VLPYRRVVVCLTKADKVFLPHARAAHQAAIEDDPRVRAADLMTRAALSALRQYGRRTQIGACWVSAYGFIRDEGSANYDQRTDGLLTHPQGGSSHHVTAGIDAWEPFQVLDPFVWVATGRLGGVRLFPDDRLTLRRAA
jgi:hypothetical protein